MDISLSLITHTQNPSPAIICRDVIDSWAHPELHLQSQTQKCDSIRLWYWSTLFLVLIIYDIILKDIVKGSQYYHKCQISVVGHARTSIFEKVISFFEYVTSTKTDPRVGSVSYTIKYCSFTVLRNWVSFFMFLLNCALDIIGVENFIRSSSISFQGSTLTVFQETLLLRKRRDEE